jgi:hypothetical protein
MKNVLKSKKKNCCSTADPYDLLPARWRSATLPAFWLNALLPICAV